MGNFFDNLIYQMAITIKHDYNILNLSYDSDSPFLHNPNPAKILFFGVIAREQEQTHEEDKGTTHCAIGSHSLLLCTYGQCEKNISLCGEW